MALTIRWKVPASASSSAVPNSINVYLSTSGENGPYALIDSVGAGGGNALSTYAHAAGDPTFGWFYYVTYTPQGGGEGPRVLAMPEPFVTEQRIAEQIQGKLPEIIAARIDANLMDIRKAMRNSLDAVNAYSPQTSYTYTNLPGRFETVIVVMAMAFLYIEHQLQVAIRDYSYGGTGVNLQVERNSKFSSTIAELNKAINGILAYVKQADWPDPMGLGTEALATPQARVFSFLFNASS